MNISPAEWARLSELLDQALDMTGEQRVMWFARLSPDDQPLSESLRKLLAQQASVETRDALETPPDFAGALLAESARKSFGDGELTANAVIGPYRLLHEIGVGGMAAVWLAERIDRKLKRQVALKFPYTGPFQRQLAERLVRERDILASLEHPNIARLYDADVSASGSPFLVLEYVEGISLIEYCDQRKLTIRQRLVLFLQVLRAVQYAHARLVIHRDIKPSNILVSQDGVAHLLDFGVAKLMPEGLAKETALTSFTGRALTPDYASPEQITGATVTTASDVYSLGVVLYELLVGARPYRLKRDSRMSLEDAITEADAIVPSRAARTAPESRKKAAQLRGDLDAILLKALRKDAAERYSTVDAFREDIERHLDGHAVLVHGGNSLYRLRKFLRRNRLATSATAAIIVALSIGLGVALWQAQRARQQALTAHAVEQFMRDIFRANSSHQSDPAQARQTTARQLLDIGASNIGSSLDAVPESKLEVLSTLSDMYGDLRLDDKAVELQRERARLARSQFGDRDPRTAEALVDLADAMQGSGSINDRSQVLAQAREILDRSGDRSSILRARLMLSSAEDLESTDRAQAVRLGDEAVAIYRKYPVTDNLPEALYVAARDHSYLEQHDVAARYLEEAIAVTNGLGGKDKGQLVMFHTYAGEAYAALMRVPEAERNFRTARALAHDIDSGKDVDSAQVAMRFGIFLCRVSRCREGLPLLSEAAETIVRVRGTEDAFHTPTVLAAYGWELANYGALEIGREYLDRAVANRRKNRPNTYPLAQMLQEQAAALTRLGEMEAAKSALDEAYAIHVRNKSSPKVMADYEFPRIEWLLATHQPAEATRIANAMTPVTLEGHKLSANWAATILARARAALESGEADRALTLSTEVRERIEASPQRPNLKLAEAKAALIQGVANLKMHRPELAKPSLARAVELITEINDASSPWLAEAQIALGEAHLELGDRPTAIALLAKAIAITAAHPKLGEQYLRPLRELKARLDHP